MRILRSPVVSSRPSLRRWAISRASRRVWASSPYFARQAFWSVEQTVKAAGMVPVAYHAWVPAFGDWGFMLMTREPVQWERLKGQPRAKFLDDAQLAVARQFAPDTARVPVQPNTLGRPVIAGYYRTGWQAFF